MLGGGKVMKVFYTIGVTVAIVGLTACSPSAMQAAPSVSHAQNQAAHQPHMHSWMLPSAKGMDLLYVSDDDAPGELLTFSYPQGDLVGEITTPSDYPAGLCADNAGDVFVTTTGTYVQSYIYEYAHAGSEPIATLTDPGSANGCAVDPKTGDLAVTNALSADSGGHAGDVAIYQGAQGAPKTYVDDKISAYFYCAYDDAGNLFVDGNADSPIVGKLPYRAIHFKNISLTKDIGPISIQWLQNKLVASGSTESKSGPQPIYTIQISGNSGAVRGPTLLESPHNQNPFQRVQFWSHRKTIVGPDQKAGAHQLLNFWRSTGGWPRKIIRRPGGALMLLGVTMSSLGSPSVRALPRRDKRNAPKTLASR
jgi:hypothetical protein